MKNPPNFVVYIVMLRTSERKHFLPFTPSTSEFKKDATTWLRLLRGIHGRGSVYIQQYGPYS